MSSRNISKELLKRLISREIDNNASFVTKLQELYRKEKKQNHGDYLGILRPNYISLKPVDDYDNLKYIIEMVKENRAGTKPVEFSKVGSTMEVIMNNIRTTDDLVKQLARIYGETKGKQFMVQMFPTLIVEQEDKNEKDELVLFYYLYYSRTHGVYRDDSNRDDNDTENHPPISVPFRVANRRDLLEAQRLCGKNALRNFPVPKSFSSIVGVVGMEIKVVILESKYGSDKLDIPDYFTNSKYIITWEKSLDTNMCFFMNLSKILKPELKDNRWRKRHAYRLFKEFYEGREELEEKPYKGFDTVNDLILVEEKYKLAINIWSSTYDAGTKTFSGTCERYSGFNMFSEYKVHHLLSYENHLMYITKKDVLFHNYACGKCKKTFPLHKKLKDHEETCTALTQHIFSKYSKLAGEKQINVLLDLKRKYPEIIFDGDFVYEWRATIDWEVFFKTIKPVEEQTKTIYLNSHIPSSVAVGGSEALYKVNPELESKFFCVSNYMSSLDDIDQDGVKKFVIPMNKDMLKFLFEMQKVANSEAHSKWQDFDTFFKNAIAQEDMYLARYALKKNELKKKRKEMIDQIKVNKEEKIKELGEELEKKKDRIFLKWIAYYKRLDCEEDINEFEQVNKDIMNNEFEQADKYFTLNEYIKRETKKIKIDANIIKRMKYHQSRKSKLKADYMRFNQYCAQMPVFGFSSRRFDLPLNKTYGIFQAMLDIGELKNEGNINRNMIKKPNEFVKIGTEKLIFLDLQCYVSAGQSLASVYKSYLGSNEKFDIPYEHFTSIKVLQEKVSDLKIEYFNSKLRGTTMKPKDFDLFLISCKEKGLETVYQLLEYYNLQDVKPMMKVIDIMQKSYFEDKIEMSKDVVSISGIAYRIRHRMATVKPIEDLMKEPFKFPFGRTYDEYEDECETYTYDADKMIEGNKKQDKLRHELDCEPDYVIPETYIKPCSIDKAFQQQCHSCYYCRNLFSDKQPYSKMTVDRINNEHDHVEGNFVLACLGCNTTRGDRYSIEEMKWRTTKTRFLRENPRPMIFKEDNKDLFYDLKKSMCGGLSIIFNRYMKANETKIQKVEWNMKEKKFVQRSTEFYHLCCAMFDAANLYGYCQEQGLPCGDPIIKLRGDVNDMMRRHGKNFYKNLFNPDIDGNDLLWIKGDFYVPENLYTYFAEFPPMIRKATIGKDDLSPNQQLLWGKNRPKSTKLIATMAAKNTIIYAPLAQWYLEHGVKIDIHYLVYGKKNACYKDFVKRTADDRRAADKTDDVVKEQKSKLISCSCYGGDLMNVDAFTNTYLSSDMKRINKTTNSPFFQSLDAFESPDGNTVYLANSRKTKVKQFVPIHVAKAILDISKLRMLSFVYDFLYKYFDREEMQFGLMDTDSLAVQFGCKSEERAEQLKPILNRIYNRYTDEEINEFSIKAKLSQTQINKRYQKMIEKDPKKTWQDARESLCREYETRNLIDFFVRPDMKEQFEKDRHLWLPREDHYDYDMRTPGLFKLEAVFHELAGNSAKCYLGLGRNGEKQKKIALKGVQKDRPENQASCGIDGYKRSIFEQLPVDVTNVGFVERRGEKYTYQVSKCGLNPLYDKMGLFEDNITTYPLINV